jgi:pteridine reductase
MDAINENAPVVLITGAARRAGRVIAKTLHNAGYRIALHYHQSKNEAEQLAAELEALRPDSVLLITGNLAEITIFPKWVTRTVQQFGRLDALVNNASSFFPTPIGDTTESQWNDLFASNSKAPFFLAQASAPHLRASKGCIINLLDIYAKRPLLHHTLYCMAKAASSMMTLSLAKELGPDIRVNGVAPGAVLWPESGKSYANQTELIGRTALKRMGTPEDIAGAVLYLLRDAPYVTGHILEVDGGRSLVI